MYTVHDIPRTAYIIQAMAPTLTPLDRPAGLADQVYRRLREHLGSHVIRPGQRLQEAALALQLGVSRTPVREALARLESDGLIAVDGRSFVVPVLSENDIDEIYELRSMLEPAALARVAGQGAPRSAIDTLATALADAVEADARADVEAFGSANARFHDGWQAFVDNRRLLNAIALNAGHVRTLRVLTLGSPAARASALHGMRAILDALRAGDADAAADAMRGHLDEARRHLRLALDDAGEPARG